MKMIGQLPLDQAISQAELDAVKRQRDTYESQIQQILEIPFRTMRAGGSGVEAAEAARFNECLESVRSILLPTSEDA